MESNVEVIGKTPKENEKLSENVIWLLMYIFSIIHGFNGYCPWNA